MNQKALDLGLTNTHFETPHGLDSDEHYTTAYELALLSNYALKNKTFAQIVGTKEYTITINNSPKQLSNTNELLGNLNGVYGIKTGFTNGANRCLVTACKRGNMYPCSLFLYALPLAAWAKGKPKDFALSFLTTMGVFFGLTNFVYLNVLKIYPLFTYASMVSFNYHFLMVFTGIFLQATGYYRPRLYSVFKAEGLFALYALVPATDRKSTRLNSSHTDISRMPSSA